MRMDRKPMMTEQDPAGYDLTAGGTGSGMRGEELCECFNISPAVLEELETSGLLGAEKTPGDRREFGREDIRLLNRILTLKNAGVELPVIRQVLTMEEQGESTRIRRMEILTEQRRKQLSQLHLKQKMIDRLDFLICELKENRTGR